MKTQFGEMITGDFEENTMTFEIEGEMILQAGKYAMVPIDEYKRLLNEFGKNSSIITSKQQNNYNQMLRTLKEIVKYQTPDKLRKDSQKDWGLDYEEALEMSYENIQQTAKNGSNGIREIK